MTQDKEMFKNIIHFDNAIMSNRRRIKGEQNQRYISGDMEENDAFDILNDISEDVTLVQLIYSLGNVNCAISIVGYWIFYSKYEKALCLTQ